MDVSGDRLAHPTAGGKLEGPKEARMGCKLTSHFRLQDIPCHVQGMFAEKKWFFLQTYLFPVIRITLHFF